MWEDAVGMGVARVWEGDHIGQIIHCYLQNVIGTETKSAKAYFYYLIKKIVLTSSKMISTSDPRML